MPRHVIAVSVGNTRTAIGRFHGLDLCDVHRFVNHDLSSIIAAIVGLAVGPQHIDATDTTGARAKGAMGAASSAALPSVILASVNNAVADEIEEGVAKAQLSVHRVGRDVHVPLGRCLDVGATPGQDRVLAAAAAYNIFKQAAVVVDAGTAVTVDYVDDDGIFHGGAIAPGAQMQLNALHEHTAQLPSIVFARPPDSDTFGRNTHSAMQLGVFEGIRGLTRALVERYTDARTGKDTPLVVIATGGDAESLFSDSPLVTHVIPDLLLHGIVQAVATSPDI